MYIYRERESDSLEGSWSPIFAAESWSRERSGRPRQLRRSRFHRMLRWLPCRGLICCFSLFFFDLVSSSSIAMPGATGNLISVQPEELKFQFELEKQSFCDLKVANSTEHYVAFKVKTTSPKKYFVRPNTGVIQPWDSCLIRVTLQAQKEYPPDMLCKDKFLLQSTIVAQDADADELPQETFNKDSGKTIDECKLRVVYVSLQAAAGNSEDELFNGSKGSSDDNSALQHLKEERELAVRQTHQLQHELDLLKRQRNRKSDPGFSFKFALLVGIIGIMVGLLLNLTLSSPATDTNAPVLGEEF